MMRLGIDTAETKKNLQTTDCTGGERTTNGMPDGVLRNT
jgi:hypothetical protein